MKLRRSSSVCSVYSDRVGPSFKFTPVATIFQKWLSPQAQAAGFSFRRFQLPKVDRFKVSSSHIGFTNFKLRARACASCLCVQDVMGLNGKPTTTSSSTTETTTINNNNNNSSTTPSEQKQQLLSSSSYPTTAAPTEISNMSAPSSTNGASTHPLSTGDTGGLTSTTDNDNDTTDGMSTAANTMTTATETTVEKKQKVNDDGFVRGIVNNAVNEVISNAVYSHEATELWTNKIVETLVRSLVQYDRDYKYIVTCMIVQNLHQGMRSATSCFWNAQSDTGYSLT